MQRLDYMNRYKGSGKSVVAAARKMAEIAWALLTEKQNFAPCRMMRKYKLMTVADVVLSAINQ